MSQIDVSGKGIMNQNMSGIGADWVICGISVRINGDFKLYQAIECSSL